MSCGGGKEDEREGGRSLRYSLAPIKHAHTHTHTHTTTTTTTTTNTHCNPRCGERVTVASMAEVLPRVAPLVAGILAQACMRREEPDTKPQRAAPPRVPCTVDAGSYLRRLGLGIRGSIGKEVHQPDTQQSSQTQAQAQSQQSMQSQQSTALHQFARKKQRRVPVRPPVSAPAAAFPSSSTIDEASVGACVHAEPTHALLCCPSLTASRAQLFSSAGTKEGVLFPKRAAPPAPAVSQPSPPPLVPRRSAKRRFADEAGDAPGAAACNYDSEGDRLFYSQEEEVEAHV